MWYWGRSSSKNPACDCEGPSPLANGDSLATRPPGDPGPCSAMSGAMPRYISKNPSRNRRKIVKKCERAAGLSLMVP